MLPSLSNSNSNLLGSGFVFYGGLFGGILGYYLGVKIAKCNFSDFVSFFVFIVPLVHGFGRIGCFCAGCCYGIPYEGFFSVFPTMNLIKKITKTTAVGTAMRAPDNLLAIASPIDTAMKIIFL